IDPTQRLRGGDGSRGRLLYDAADLAHHVDEPGAGRGRRHTELALVDVLVAVDRAKHRLDARRQPLPVGYERGIAPELDERLLHLVDRVDEIAEAEQPRVALDRVDVAQHELDRFSGYLRVRAQEGRVLAEQRPRRLAEALEGLAPGVQDLA